MYKVIAGLVIFLILAGAAYVTATYLLSKLDGTGGVTAPYEEPTMGTLQYSSEDGYTFMYPDTYEISSRPGQAGDGDVLVLLPKDYVPPQGGEGPPAIAVQTLSNPKKLSLEQWVRTDMRSNFQLSDGTLVATTLGGKPAFSYHHSGLYETDAIVAEHNGKVVVFSVGWASANDPLVHDFDHLVETVQFN